MTATVVETQQIPGTDPEYIGEVFRHVADDAVRRFNGRNARVHNSATVHAVRLERWIGRVMVPAPLCHVGIGGFAMDAVTPSTAPVNCVRCLHKLDVDPDAASDQPRLW